MQAQADLCIIAYNIHPNFWDPDVVEKGIGGAQEAVINLSSCLASKGYKVTVFGNPPENSRWANSNPSYKSFTKDLLPILLISSPKRYNVVLLWRTPKASVFKDLGHKLLFWPHDDPKYFSLSDEDAHLISKTFWLSKNQAERWLRRFPLLANNSSYELSYGNGVCPEQFQGLRKCSNPYSCIYASSYVRGLKHLLAVWPQIKQLFPLATLDIYFGVDEWEKREALPLVDKIKSMSSIGVAEHGKIGHVELAGKFLSSSFWVYPCSVEETFCITGLKAQAGGCIPVTTTIGALDETVTYGYKIDYTPDKQFEENFLNLLQKAMTEVSLWDDQKREQMQKLTLLNSSWAKVAEKMESLLF